MGFIDPSQYPKVIPLVENTDRDSAWEDQKSVSKNN